MLAWRTTSSSSTTRMVPLPRHVRAAGSSVAAARAEGRRRGRRAGAGEEGTHRRAAPRLAFDQQPAPVPAHDAQGRGQAEAAAIPFGGEERVEEVRQSGSIHPLPVIGDLQVGVGALRRSPSP